VPAENVWLIELQNDMPLFSQLLAEAEKLKLQYKLHFFLESPEWMQSS
jgi:hypothetical protein